MSKKSKNAKERQWEALCEVLQSELDEIAAVLHTAFRETREVQKSLTQEGIKAEALCNRIHMLNALHLSVLTEKTHLPWRLAEVISRRMDSLANEVKA